MMHIFSNPIFNGESISNISPKLFLILLTLFIIPWLLNFIDFVFDKPRLRYLATGISVLYFCTIVILFVNSLLHMFSNGLYLP
jgi:4-amino-4-deoxy-L-arabinose transferase-like glycosyltransferase